jgi:antitoxin component of MazEF toxin-antitoxin module
MLTRKIRKIGTSYVITIPMQMADVLDYKPGMKLQVTMNSDSIVFRRLKKDGSGKRLEKAV